MWLSKRAFEQAKSSHGQIVGVMGEPGVGKSRLFHEFKLLSQRGCLVLETFSVSHGKAYPYLPLIDLLKNYFQLTLQDDERKRREKVTGKVLTLDRSLSCAPLPKDLHLPPTVQGILTARIDRLPPDDKALLQTLAVIGKEFPLSLLKQVVSKSEANLQTQLAHLQAAEFIYEQPAFPEPEYTFKHALMQEVAYNSVLIERRKVLHERTAQAIEVLFHSRLEDYYGDLAHHYSRSGNTQKAVEYLQRAGQQAVQRSANAEAITHLTTALELLNALPDTPERVQQELGLHLTLGPVLMNIRGMAAPEVGALYTRARELCQQVGETSQLFPVLFGLSRFSLLRAELQLARELGEQLLRLAQQAQDSALLLGAHRALGATLLWQGEMPLAREHVEQGIALYDPQQHRSLAFVYGMDIGMTCRIFAAWVLWLLGYPDQALKRSHEAITLAQELSHPYSLSFALEFTADLHQFRREWRLAQERAEAAIALSAEQGFALALSQAAILRGWALVEQGQGKDGIAQMQQGLAAYRETGAKLTGPYFLALLAEAYGKGGQIAEGLSVLAEALTAVDKNGERFYEAELYWLAGELSLRIRRGEGEKGRAGEEKTVPRSPIPPFFSRRVLPQGHCDCPPPAGKVPRAASGNELGSSVAATGQKRTKPGSC